MLETWVGGELDVALSMMDERIEWQMADDEPDARTLRGRDEIRSMVEGWAESFQDFSAAPQEFIDAEEAVVVPLIFKGRPRDSDTPVTLEETQVYTLRAGLVIKVCEYRTKAQALEAVGLAE
jgi:ketosteroid isomerase-like protein